MTAQDMTILLREIDALRAELRQKEIELTAACLDFGKRRGCYLYREHHVRSDIAREK